MSFTTAEHFAKTHGGFEGLIKLSELINTENNLALIASHFQLSPSQVCRLRAQLFEQIWKPKRGLIEYVEFQQNCLEREASRRCEFIKEKSKLQFVIGGLLHEQANS